MNEARNASALIGRLMLAAIFVLSGFHKFGDFAGTAGYIASKGLPLPQGAAAIAVVVELAGGLMIAAGYRTRWAAAVLAVFTLAAGFLFHAFWLDPPAAQTGNFVNFWKNVSIAGAFLLVFAFGPGRYSIDGG